MSKSEGNIQKLVRDVEGLSAIIIIIKYIIIIIINIKNDIKNNT